MIELLLDIGNSRVKLALVEDHDYEYLGAFSIENLTTESTALTFLDQLDFIPSHVYVSSVASEQVDMQIRQAVASKWGVMPIFMSTQLDCCDVKNGYDQPFKLGVDRWLALMGAREYTSNDFIVIDAGTAITVDQVKAGQHQGGFIVPGIRTLRQSLTNNTANLTADCDLGIDEPGIDSNPSRPAQFLATNTQSAICGGTLYMASAFVNGLITDLLSSSETLPNIYFTGGDGALLSSLLTMNSDYIEDLVLQGIINVKESIKKS